MLTNDMPQCYHIIKARGRQAEWSRLHTAPAVVKKLERFYTVSPNKTALTVSPLGLRTLRRKQALRARTTDPIEIGGIRQRGLMVAGVLRQHHGRLRPLP